MSICPCQLQCIKNTVQEEAGAGTMLGLGKVGGKVEIRKERTAFNILDDTVQVPNGNDDASAKEHGQPILHDGLILGALFAHADIEDQSDNDEEAKDDDLQHQTGKNNILSVLQCRRRLGTGQHRTSQRLDEKAQDVAADEDLGQPGRADDAEVG